MCLISVKKMSTVAQSEQLGARPLPKTINFLFCPSCYWCASAIGNWKPDSCPSCNNNNNNNSSISLLQVGMDKPVR